MTERYMRRLGVRLMLYRYAYYVHSHSIISDAEYDELERELVELNNSNRSYAHPQCITAAVGSDIPAHYPGFIRGMYAYYMAD